MRHRTGAPAGQAAILLVGCLCAVLVAALVLGAVARGLGVRSGAQRWADLAAVAAARAMLDAYPRLFDSGLGGMPKAAYLATGRGAAGRVARANGADRVRVTFARLRRGEPSRAARR